MEKIKDIKKNCNYLIVVYHGGKEFYRYPSPYLKELCEFFTKIGADIVICQHSHCIGAQEKLDDKTIIYGQGNLAGRGGWTWYTGSSSWMYIAGIKYILGLNILNGYMYFNPSISSSWNEYSIRYKYGESIYNIKVINKSGKNTGVKKVSLNGSVVEDGKVKLQSDGSVNEIEVEMWAIITVFYSTVIAYVKSVKSQQTIIKINEKILETL